MGGEDLKRKIGVALGIFFLLFSGSWFLDEKLESTEKEVQTVESQEGTMNISDVKIDKHTMFEQLSIKFLPREYIRFQDNSSGQ